MSVYHQMGNDSINLVFEPNLSVYKGAIISPVNATKAETLGHVERMRALSEFEVIFDPQLYYPRSDRGCLPTWDYFPEGADTSDVASLEWWYAVADRLIDSMSEVQPNAICSPASVPSVYPDEFFSHCVEVSNHLTARLAGSGVESVLTLIVKMSELSVAGRALAIASIASRADCSRVYLVLEAEVDPRREVSAEKNLMGAMKLIRAIEDSGMKVIVSFCSSDVLLWKHAGATACATGKFFNLRRFTLKRFAETIAGGGQLPYWFEESLLAFIRQSDLIRIKPRGLLSDSSRRNPFLEPIFECITSNKAWIGLSWRQFMWWFADVEARLSNGSTTARNLVDTADRSWAEVETPPRIFFEERANDGSWVRSWLRALEELPFFP